jgi:hypothetical protein
MSRSLKFSDSFVWINKTAKHNAINQTIKNFLLTNTIMSGYRSSGNEENELAYFEQAALIMCKTILMIHAV